MLNLMENTPHLIPFPVLFFVWKEKRKRKEKKKKRKEKEEKEKEEKEKKKKKTLIAPSRTRILIASTLPFIAATWRGVFPLKSLIEGCTPEEKDLMNLIQFIEFIQVIY